MSGVELHFRVAAIKGALVRLAALSGRKLTTMDLQPAVRPPFKIFPDSLKKSDFFFLFKEQFCDATI